MHVYQFKKNRTNPEIVREIHVKAAITLYSLTGIFLTAFGFRFVKKNGKI